CGGWLRECMLRFFPNERKAGAEGALLATLLRMAVVTAALPLLAVGLTFVIPGALASYRDLIPWVGAWVVFGLLYVPLSSFLQAGLQARRYALWVVVRALLGFVLTILYVLFVRRHIVGAFVGLAGSTLIVGLLIARGLHMIDRTLSVQPIHQRSTVRWIELFRYGLPLAGWALGLEVLNLADRFIVNWFHGSAAVGVYSSSYYLADGGTALLMLPLLAAVRPLIMQASSTGQPEDVQRLVTSVSRVLLLLLLPCLAATVVLAQRIALVLLDPNYTQGYVVLPLVVAGVGAWSLGQLGHTGLQLAHRTKTMFVGVVSCAAVNVALNLAVVPRWSYTGAAVTTLISYSLYPLFVYWTSRGILRWRFPWATLGRSAAAATVMGVTLAVTWGRWTDSLVLRLGLSCLSPAVYVGMLFLLRELSREDWKHVCVWLKERLRIGQGEDPR
ncbi:polysaccharide biosynthesis C-terminal domain-containing protein, partial [Candidatus Bipolaricaulota bacterium]